MKINEIEIAGFRGFRNTVRIPLSSGFTIITGRNGTGKTTVCDAIEFGLTGKLRRFTSSQRDKRERGEITEKGERIEDYIWWRGKNPTSNKHVRLSFLDKNGEAFEHLQETGLSQGPRPDFLYYGEQTPENPLELLCQTAILRDEHITALSTDLRETERFEFVNAAIGVSDLIAVEKRAAGIVSSCAEEMKKLEGAYQKLRDEVSRLTSDITEVKGNVQSLSESLGENSIEEVAVRLGIQSHGDKAVVNEVRTTIVSLRREIERLEKLFINVKEATTVLIRAEELGNQLSSSEETIRLADTKVQRAFAARAEADEKLRSAEAKAPIQSALAILVEQGTRLNLQNGRCPLCGSEVTEADFQSHVSAIRNDIARHNAELAGLAHAQADASGKYAFAKSEFETLSAENRRIKGELESLNQTGAKLSEEAKALGVQTNEESVSAGLQSRLARLRDFETHLDALEARATNERLIELQHQRDLVQQQADSLAERIEFMSRVSQGARTASDATKRVSREIIEERLAALNPLLSELYSRLKPHVAYEEVKYRMRGDVLRFLRLEVGEDINPRFTFSSGQRRALGLAFLLAVYFTRPWCKLKTLVLDDPVQHIDDYRALHLAEVLASVRQLGHQVICTVEDPALANLLCRRLRSSEGEQGSLVELSFSGEQGSGIKTVAQIAPLPSTVLLSA
jgi:chromosome segregation protein